MLSWALAVHKVRGFKVNESAVVEYSRLQENRINTINTDYVDCNSLIVSLLNTQFLKTAFCRYQQSQAAYRKQYSLLDRKSNYK